MLIFVLVALLVVLCVGLHSPALCHEAHSQGTVLSSFLIAVSLLLCWRTSYCDRQANTLLSNSHPLSYLPFLHWCCISAAISLLSFPSLNVSLLTANQRAGKAVDPAGRWVLWQRPRPCTGDKEMGVLGRQALPGLLSPHGQIPNLPGDGTRHFFWLQQGCECTPLIKNRGRI